jgi:hypothetical protein
MDFKKVVTWLVTSSKDPKRLSLTVQGALLAVAPFVMYLTGLTDADFNAFVEGVVNFVFAATTAFAALQVAYGVLRKVKFGRWSALN